MASQTNGIVWDDKLRMGNEQVDSQHMRLFELVNGLVDQCVGGGSIVKLKETLEFLVGYTVRHFYDEEAIQVIHNYPGYKEHKGIHERFKESVGGLVKRFEESGSSEELNNDLNKTVIRWLVNHIWKEDRKIGAHIHGVTSREIGY